MTEWLIASLLLLAVSAVYCARNMVADFRAANISAGIWGAVSLAGPLSCLALALTAVLLSLYYH
ncbi:hypothetical protein HZY97_17950 [Sphingomonas sp. R-74633]|uniref:hypothetical protein n=1 Tax=Sphingomonas sp. R-74633 TaxID=2751188 RepID=UPI0015D1B8BB|nr:hypothetical protein [Sphingomonas sp. R-74633]NYT42662.1 hypothetical protein [Sphingomonas sp. R-74633]